MTRQNWPGPGGSWGQAWADGGPTVTTAEEASKAGSQLERFLQKKDDSPEGRAAVKGTINRAGRSQQCMARQLVQRDPQAARPLQTPASLRYTKRMVGRKSILLAPSLTTDAGGCLPLGCPTLQRAPLNLPVSSSPLQAAELDRAKGFPSLCPWLPPCPSQETEVCGDTPLPPGVLTWTPQTQAPYARNLYLFSALAKTIHLLL